jgi:hypothetical protein
MSTRLLEYNHGEWVGYGYLIPLLTGLQDSQATSNSSVCARAGEDVTLQDVQSIEANSM